MNADDAEQGGEEAEADGAEVIAEADATDQVLVELDLDGEDSDDIDMRMMTPGDLFRR